MALLRSVFSKIRRGLEKTREVLGLGLVSLLRGKRLDESLLGEIESRLLRADVGVVATTALVDGLRSAFREGRLASGDDALEFLKREMRALWPSEDRALATLPAGTPLVILVTGVNGAGKTTSIAKLASHLKSQGKSVMLAACDTFRAGAVRQLEIWGERLGVPVVRGQQGGDPAAVAFDACQAAVARGADVLILDTAGRLQTQDPLMRQLAKLRTVVGKRIPGAPHESLLVLDATAGQNALRQAEEFAPAAGVTGILLTKLDGTAKGGIVVAIATQSKIPVKFVGVGETPDDLEAFDPDRFVEALFEETSERTSSSSHADR